MARLKLGVHLGSLRQPFKQALHTAAQLGATGVEIDARGEVRPEDLTDTGVRQIRKLLDDLGLHVAAVRFATRRGYDVTDDLDRRIDATRRAMQMAYRLRAPVVVNHVGRVPADETDPRWEVLVASLTDLAHWGDRVGALLAAQTGTESGADLARLLAALPEAAVGVDLHPGRLVSAGFDPLEVIAAVGGAIRHVHAADGSRLMAGTRAVEVPLGRGLVDYAALLGALEEHNYQGYFTVERLQSADPVAEVATALEFLRSL